MLVRKVFLVGGARPNFMKVAPLYRAFQDEPRWRVFLVHTGQHYDDKMAGNFFRDLGLPDPDISLSVGSGTHGSQTARILERFEAALIEHEPEVVIVVGDVNSTIACALAASKMQYRWGGRPTVVHVEAGLRSGDRTMPEEVNRILTDSISDLLFVTEQSGVDNLMREGQSRDKVFFVGNVMIDTLIGQLAEAERRAAWARFGLVQRGYAVATLHRPSNVDDDAKLRSLMMELHAISQRLPIVFPVHPRTRGRLETLGLDRRDERLILCEPQPYVEFVSLLKSARLVLTDSGGIQEETTILKVPCLTLRDNTERPVTVTVGSNRLIGTHLEAIRSAVAEVLDNPDTESGIPELWDGNAAHRIVTILGNALLAPVEPVQSSPEVAVA